LEQPIHFSQHAREERAGLLCRYRCDGLRGYPSRKLGNATAKMRVAASLEGAVSNSRNRGAVASFFRLKAQGVRTPRHHPNAVLIKRFQRPTASAKKTP
jgi:hypothetical protein